MLTVYLDDLIHRCDPQDLPWFGRIWRTERIQFIQRRLHQIRRQQDEHEQSL